MSYNFIWLSPNAGAPIVTIATYGINFNVAVIEVMKKPARIMFGFDESTRTIGIKPASDINDNRAFPFAERERSGNIRISNKDLIRYISSKTGIDFATSKRFIADWNEAEQLLTIDLTKPLDEYSDDE